MQFRTIRVSKENANKLAILKYRLGFRDINQVVEMLLNEYMKEGEFVEEG